MSLIDELRGKKKAFVLAYLRNGFNGTRAAQAAGYKGSDATLAQVAYENLRKPDIAAAIKEAMEEMAMPAHEALARLSAMARGDLGDFAGLTEADLEGHPQSFLLHSLKRRTIPQRGGEPIIEVEIRLYDAQAALGTILKQHQLAEGKPTEIVKLYETVSPDDWDDDPPENL